MREWVRALSDQRIVERGRAQAPGVRFTGREDCLLHPATSVGQ